MYYRQLNPKCSGDGYQTAIILLQPMICFTYRIPVVLSRRYFAINWLKIGDFGLRSLLLECGFKIGLCGVIRVCDIIINTWFRLVVICGKHIDGREVNCRARLSFQIPMVFLKLWKVFNRGVGSRPLLSLNFLK